MSKTFRMAVIWGGLTLVLFFTFLWLFGIALPGAALPFSIGITTVLMGGLLSGWYGVRIFFNPRNPPKNNVFTMLVAGFIVSFFMVAFLASQMMGETELLEFALAVLFLFLMSACAGSLVSLLRVRVQSRLQLATQVAEHSKSELQLLQSQLSPHFLFNTLNNVYGLSITDHTKVPALLLKLSDLLRYSVYETREMYVPIENELAYLNNYIDFEKIRLGDRLVLTSNLDQTSAAGFKIAPMILIVFVENAFKYARNTSAEKISIEIVFRYDNESMFFSINNSYAPVQQTETQSRQSGVGLANVKKRLALLYDAAHTLEIVPSGSVFTINLSLAIVP